MWINNATARVALTNAEVAVTNSRVAVETLRVAERGHLTDRYAKAIEQLGDYNDAVRLGGIYGLQQYAEDSTRPGDQRTVVEVLSAFIRDKLAGVGGSDGTHELPGADALAAMSVLAQLPVREGVVRAYIPGALFHSVNISGARLEGGDLSGVRMDKTAGIRSADLSNINLDGANFDNASLTRCDLTGASLRGTIFRTGELSDLKLHDADLEGALQSGTVTGEETEFNRANLRGADLGKRGPELGRPDRGGSARHAPARCQVPGAVLDDANFTGARDLVDGQLTAKQIAVAKNLPPTLKPKPEEDETRVGLRRVVRPAGEPSRQGLRATSDAPSTVAVWSAAGPGFPRRRCRATGPRTGPVSADSSARNRRCSPPNFLQLHFVTLLASTADQIPICPWPRRTAVYPGPLKQPSLPSPAFGEAGAGLALEVDRPIGETCASHDRPSYRAVIRPGESRPTRNRSVNFSRRSSGETVGAFPVARTSARGRGRQGRLHRAPRAHQKPEWQRAGARHWIPINGDARRQRRRGKSNVARARSRLARTSRRPSRSVRFATRFTRSRAAPSR